MEIMPVVVFFFVLFFTLDAVLIYLSLWVFDRRNFASTGLFQKIIRMVIIVFVVNAVVCDVLSDPPFKFPLLVVGQSVGALAAFLSCQPHRMANSPVTENAESTEAPQQDADPFAASNWRKSIQRAFPAVALFVTLKMAVWSLMKPSILQ